MERILKTLWRQRVKTNFISMDICIYLVAHNQFKGVNIKDDDLDFCGGIE